MKKLVLIPLLAAFSLPAFASGLYVTGSVGKTSYTNGPNIPYALRQLGPQTSESTKSTGYKLQLGYQFNEHFALEGGYVNLGSTSSTANNAQTGVKLSSSMKAQGLNAVAVGIIPIGERFSLFGKAGIIYASSDTNNNGEAPGVPTMNTTVHQSNAAPTWGIGAAYKLTEKVALRADFDQYRNQGNSGNKQSVNLFSLGAGLSF